MKAMSNGSASRRFVGGLLSLALTVMAALTVIHFAPAIGRSAGDRFADNLRKEQGIASPQEKAAARAKAAKTRFVPAAHRQFPRLTAGVPDTRLAGVATGTCDLFENYYQVPHYQDKVRALVRRTLTHKRVKPTPAQVNKVIRLASTTTCPNKQFLTAQFN